MEEDQGRKKEQEKQVIKTVENVEEFLAWIKRLTGQFFLYRGLANAKWKVESSAQRRIELSGGESSPSAFQNYIDDLLNETRLLGFGDKHGRKLSDLELLAELQHNNAATCLIDFTHNALIALWFACKEESEETGKVVAMATDDDTKFMKINYENLGNYIVEYPKAGYFLGLVFGGSAAAKMRRNASSGLLTFSFNTRVSGRPRLRLSCSGMIQGFYFAIQPFLAFSLRRPVSV